jgi:hypothetical protein
MTEILNQVQNDTSKRGFFVAYKGFQHDLRTRNLKRSYAVV